MGERTKKPFIAALYGNKRWGIGRAGCGGAHWFFQCKDGDCETPQNREEATLVLASLNAADRLGLTADKLNDGVVEKLVEAARNIKVALENNAAPMSVEYALSQSGQGALTSDLLIDLFAALAAFPAKGEEVGDGNG